MLSHSAEGLPQAGQDYPVGTLTLAFTDLENSSGLSEKHGREFEEYRDIHFRLLRQELGQGFEVETAGDSLFAVFSTPTQAVRWALQAQCAMMAFPWPEHIGPLKVRMGLHTGEPFISLDEKTARPTYRGPVTNLTARIMGAAHGGQILLCDSVLAVAPNLPADARLKDLGRHRFKGVGVHRIWQVSAPGLPEDYSPINSLRPQRHNLPLPPTPFVSRDAVVAEWRTILHDATTRVLTLWGFGGVGKTRAALELAESCVEEFANGVWWVNLDQVKSAEQMVAAIAGQIGIRPGAEDVSHALRSWLADKEMLLVLDNTEQIEDAAAVVRSILEGGRQVKCLVTTRHPLGLRGEKRREVPPMTQSESIRLFLQGAHDVGVELSPGDKALQAVCRRLEGLPLAIELAASLADTYAPRDILSRLDNQLRLLRSVSGDFPKRHSALSAVIDWSHDMLGEKEQILFAELAVFAGGFGLEDAEAISSVEDPVFQVKELHRRSLLRVLQGPDGANRYVMLEAVRDYAAGRLASFSDSGFSLRAKHASHFLKVFESYGQEIRSSGEGAALALAQLNMDNAREAIGWMAGNPGAVPADSVSRMAVALSRLMQRLGHLNEAAKFIALGLDHLPPQALSTGLEAELLLNRGFGFYDAFQWSEAQEAVERALGIFQRLELRAGLGESHNLLGLLALRGSKNYEVARYHLELALQEFGAVRQDVARGIVLSNLGLVHRAQGDNRNARENWEKALALHRLHGYQRGAAEALNNLGVLAQDSGDGADARRHYRAALQLEAELGSQFGMARAMFNLGELAAHKENFGEALHLLAAAAELFERAGSPFGAEAIKLMQNLPGSVSQELGEVRIRCRDLPLGEFLAALPGLSPGEGVSLN